ncbi:MAG: hypothetical protein A2044_08095 [Candidatus Firestonebacteria bacterium GWA2_43_8]|nr:MAG: hypothetical protein A2044_08095 [Candidatus Firestonebacteria bacterium GWA2_43_8]
MEKLLRWGILGVLFFVPLFSPEWFPYLNLLYPVLIGTLLVLFVLNIILIKKEGLPASAGVIPAVLLITAFIFAALFSKAVSFNPVNILIIYLVIIFLVVSKVFTSPADRKNAALAVLAGAVLAALYAFYQKYTGFSELALYLEKHKELASDSVIYREFLKNIGGGRVFSSFLNANVFAGFIAMSLPIAFGYLFYSFFPAGQSTVTKKLGIGLVILVLFVALAMTRSFGGIIALLLALLVFFMAVVENKKKFLLIGGTLIVISFGTAIIMRPDVLDFTKADNSILNRLGYFSEAFKIFLRNPFFGSGVNTYASLAGDGVKYPHNWYLQVLAETGIVGFTALLYFIITVLRKGLQNIKLAEGSDKFIFAGIFAGFCGFLIHNLFDIDSNVWQNSLIAFTLAGIAASGFASKVKVKKAKLSSARLTGFLSRNYFFIFAVVLVSASIMLSFSTFEYEALLMFVFLNALLFLMLVSLNKKFSKTKLDYFIVALFLVCFASLFVSVNRFASFQAVNLLLGCVILYYSAVNNLNKLKAIGVFSFFTGLGCLLLSLTGIFQYIWFKTERVEAFFPNANFLGGFLAAGIGFLLYNIPGKKGTMQKFYAVSAGISLICLVLTKSRGALLALGVIVIFFLLALAILKKKKAVTEPVRFWSTVSILVVLAFLISPLNPVVKRASSVGIYDDAAYSRSKIAVSALRLFEDRPLLGYGLKTFKDAAPKHSFPEGGTIGNFTRVAHHAHNEYLQTLAELGIAGGILILVFLFILVNRFITVIKNTTDKDKLFTAFAVFTALLGLLTHALVDFNLHCLPTLVFFVLLTGLLFSGYLEGNKNLTLKDSSYTKFKTAAVLFAAVFVISAVMSYFSVYFYRQRVTKIEDFEKNMKLSIFLNPMYADSYIGVGRLTGSRYFQTKDNKLFFEAEKNFKQAIKNNSENAECNKELGLFYHYAGYENLAMQEYAAAIRKSPNDVFLKTELAKICFLAGKYEQAEKYAREAVKLEPNYADGHLGLYEIYTKLKRNKAAEFEKKRALEINRKYKDTAVITYEKNLVSLGGVK